MSDLRRRAVLIGVLYLVTHVTSVAALVLYRPLLSGATDARASAQSEVAVILEMVLAIAVIGTAIGFRPVLARRSETGATAYLALRILEAALIVLGVAAVLAVLFLQRSAGSTGPHGARELIALHDASFLLGPSLVLSVSTTILATVLLHSGLVPRFVPLLGLIGGPLVFVSSVLTVTGVIDQVSAWGGLLALPAFAWELSLALTLIIRGFRPAAGSVPTAAA